MSDQPLSMAFWLIAELCSARGLAPLNKHPGVVVVNAGPWRIFVNGHDEPKPTPTGEPVPRYSAVLYRSSWPAGMLNPYGGVIFRLTQGKSTEDDLIDHLRAEVLALTGKDPVVEAERAREEVVVHGQAVSDG